MGLARACGMQRLYKCRVGILDRSLLARACGMQHVFQCIGNVWQKSLLACAGGTGLFPAMLETRGRRGCSSRVRAGLDMTMFHFDQFGQKSLLACAGGMVGGPKSRAWTASGTPGLAIDVFSGDSEKQLEIHFVEESDGFPRNDQFSTFERYKMSVSDT